eukprot:1161116-Rhodomonas_salina.1
MPPLAREGMIQADAKLSLSDRHRRNAAAVRTARSAQTHKTRTSIGVTLKCAGSAEGCRRAGFQLQSSSRIRPITEFRSRRVRTYSAASALGKRSPLTQQLQLQLLNHGLCGRTGPLRPSEGMFVPRAQGGTGGNSCCYVTFTLKKCQSNGFGYNLRGSWNSFPLATQP